PELAPVRAGDAVFPRAGFRERVRRSGRSGAGATRRDNPPGAAEDERPVLPRIDRSGSVQRTGSDLDDFIEHASLPGDGLSRLPDAPADGRRSRVLRESTGRGARQSAWRGDAGFVLDVVQCDRILVEPLKSGTTEYTEEAEKEASEPLINA